MIVKLNDLNKILELLLAKADNSGFREVKIDKDYYWSIDADDRINFNTDQPEICTGSLYDDLQELHKVLTKKTMPTILDFERLGNILIFIGNKISKSDRIY